MKRPPISIRRRAELALAKLKDMLSRAAPTSDLEALRRNQEFMADIELHCKGALRNGMVLMAEKFEEMGDVRLSAGEVAEMLRGAEEMLRGPDDGYLGRCPACDRPFEEHGRFYIGNRFECVICMSLPVDLIVMLGPQTANEFQKEAKLA